MDLFLFIDIWCLHHSLPQQHAAVLYKSMDEESARPFSYNLSSHGARVLRISKTGQYLSGVALLWVNAAVV